MDFLDPQKKRAHRIRLFIGYGLVAVALGFGSLILLFAVNGYGVDRKTGTIIQNGLVFFDSHSAGSNVFINGAEKGRTDARYVLEEGNYAAELREPGYRTWKRSFTLDGGSIERFVYPFMFPTNLVSKDVQLYGANPDMVSSSPDRNWIVSHNSSVLNKFDVTDTSTADNATTSITVPETVLTAQNGTEPLEFVEWSSDNRHFLVKQTYASGVDFVMIDRENPAASYNVTQVFGKSYSQVTMHDKRFDRLYIFDGAIGTLQAANANTKAITPIADKVLAFWPYGSDIVLYVTDAVTLAQTVTVRIIQNEKTYTLRNLPKSDKYLMNIAEFNKHLYVAVGTSTESRIYLYQDPLDNSNAALSKLPRAKALLKVDTAEHVTFSANARFIALQGGSQFAIYDAEKNRQYRYDQKLPLLPRQKASWMDGHRLMLVSEDKINVFDFDGTNKQVLTSANAGFVPFFNQNYTAMFAVAPSVTVANKSAVVRTELILK